MSQAAVQRPQAFAKAFRRWNAANSIATASGTVTGCSLRTSAKIATWVMRTPDPANLCGLSDDRRYEVSFTVISIEFTSDMLRERIREFTLP